MGRLLLADDARMGPEVKIMQPAGEIFPAIGVFPVQLRLFPAPTAFDCYCLAFPFLLHGSSFMPMHPVFDVCALNMFSRFHRQVAAFSPVNPCGMVI
jgi:hypothetical protein